MNDGLIIGKLKVVDVEYRTTMGKWYIFITCQHLETKFIYKYWGECYGNGDRDRIQEIVDYGHSWDFVP